MRNAKKIIATLIVGVGFASQVLPLWANGTVATIENGNKVYVPIKAVTTKMGGTVTRKDEDKAFFFSVNGKTVRLDDNIPFGSVDGQFAPFETREVRGFKVPVFNKAIYKDDDIYVPINFLTDSVGLKLEAKDGQVAFDTPVGESTVATANTSSNSGPGSNSPVVESNRPATTNPSTPTNNGGNSGGSTTTPTQPTKPSGGSSSGGNSGGSTTPTTPTTPTQPEQPKPQPPKPQPQPTKTYTGSQVKQKLYGLGFFDKGSGVVYNIHGQGALDEYDYLSFSVSSGDKDMVLAIFNSNPEVDQKIRTTLSYILPSEGGRLYSILDNPSLKSQTLTMEGRTVTISIQSYGIKVIFGPIVK